MLFRSEHCGITEWPELAPAVEILYDKQELADALRSYAAKPASERDQRRKQAREHCEAFAKTTIEKWRDTLIEVARKD